MEEIRLEIHKVKTVKNPFVHTICLEFGGMHFFTNNQYGKKLVGYRVTGKEMLDLMEALKKKNIVIVDRILENADPERFYDYYAHEDYPDFDNTVWA